MSIGQGRWRAKGKRGEASSRSYFIFSVYIYQARVKARRPLGFLCEMIRHDLNADCLTCSERILAVLVVEEIVDNGGFSAAPWPHE